MPPTTFVMPTVAWSSAPTKKGVRAVYIYDAQGNLQEARYEDGWVEHFTSVPRGLSALDGPINPAAGYTKPIPARRGRAYTRLPSTTSQYGRSVECVWESRGGTIAKPSQPFPAGCKTHRMKAGVFLCLLSLYVDVNVNPI